MWGPCGCVCQVEHVLAQSRAEHAGKSCATCILVSFILILLQLHITFLFHLLSLSTTGVQAGDIILSLQKHLPGTSTSLQSPRAGHRAYPREGHNREGDGLRQGINSECKGGREKGGEHCLELNQLSYSKTCVLLQRSDQYNTSVRFLGARLKQTQTERHRQTLRHRGGEREIEWDMIRPDSYSSYSSTTKHNMSKPDSTFSPSLNSPSTATTTQSCNTSPPPSAIPSVSSPLVGTELLNRIVSYDSLTSLGMSASVLSDSVSFCNLYQQPLPGLDDSFYTHSSYKSKDGVTITPMNMQAPFVLLLSTVFGSTHHIEDGRHSREPGSKKGVNNSDAFFDNDALASLRQVYYDAALHIFPLCGAKY